MALTALQRRYGNRQAAQLGLPSIEWMESSARDAAPAYKLACETISKQRQPGGPPAGDGYSAARASDLEPLRRAIGQMAPAHGVSSRNEADNWLIVLKRWCSQKALAQRSSAPQVLRFWLELCRLQDLGASVNDEDAKTLRFADLDRPLPALEGAGGVDGNEAMLVICRPSADLSGKSREIFVPVVGVQLCLDDDGAIGVPQGAQLLINQDEFFEPYTNEPRGDLEEDNIAAWVGLQDVPAGQEDQTPNGAMDSAADDAPELAPSPSVEPWPRFLARWQKATAHWLGDGDPQVSLKHLSVILRGQASRQFVIRLISKIVETGHAQALAQVAQAPQQYPLLQRVLDRLGAPVDDLAPLRLSQLPADEFLGHMDTCKDGRRSRAFPLDPTQRLAAMSVARLPFGQGSEILPVNGPPGTGKTSFLRATLASIWVRAALEQQPTPMVVYGIAATNQAVSNMIEAFGAIRSTEPDGPAYPWLEGLPSYGWYFPSRDAALERPDLMHLAWSDASRDPVAMAGAAAGFAARSLDEHRAVLLERAALALDLSPGGAGLSLEQVTQACHERLLKLHQQLLNAQALTRERLPLAAQAWQDARLARGKLRQACAALEREREKDRALTQRLEHYKKVLALTRQFHALDLKLETGWRLLLPAAMRQWLWRREIADCQSLRVQAQQSCAQLGLAVPGELALRPELFRTLEGAVADLTRQQAEGWERLARAQAQRDGTERLLAQRRRSLDDLKRAATPVEGAAPWGLKFYRALHAWSAQGLPAHKDHYEQLVHEFEAVLDTTVRVPLFHWAARYWECRWVQAQSAGPAVRHSEKLERLMMLGVIIVATTHKVLKLGEYRCADLLIMDEAGQCLPQIAGACLTAARTAAFIGDTRQIEPVSSMSRAMVQAIEHRISSQGLIAAVKPLGGSGMLLAQAAAECRCGDAPGVTLVYHYRCVPEIIGYCNELMYAGTIRCVRREPRMAHLHWLPPMSWVGVQDSPPERRGSSWVNLGEVTAIGDWLEAERDRLTTVQDKDGGQIRIPLREVVAIVTPLARQAEAIRQNLEQRLGAQAIEGMVIGTVHKLQGAERPVVLFSLVQTEAFNGNLMADRDGGNLMNVAVSRARDAFVIFADRKTLRPAPVDARLDPRSSGRPEPVAILGRYMRAHGRRLFPSVLVIVEAPGKRAAIARALGPQAEVLATGGFLRQCSLSEGCVTFTASPTQWLALLGEHAGLVDEVVIATDDDLAGELIGMHAAEDAAATLALGVAAGRPLRVRRMRFADLTEQSLRLAYEAAGDRFDADRLAAAWVREFANLVDEELYRQSHLPMWSYRSAQVRDALAWLNEAQPSEPLYELHCTLTLTDGSQAEGRPVRGFVARSSSATSEPLALAEGAAKALGDRLIADGRLAQVARRRAVQKPGLYPANTTGRVLALAVDELGLDVQAAQDHLNALYLQGAQDEAGGAGKDLRAQGGADER